VFKESENNRFFNEQLEEIKAKNNPMGILEMFAEDIRQEEREKFAQTLLADTEFSDGRVTFRPDILCRIEAEVSIFGCRSDASLKSDIVVGGCVTGKTVEQRIGESESRDFR